jgi:hypothetical protein
MKRRHPNRRRRAILTGKFVKGLLLPGLLLLIAIGAFRAFSNAREYHEFVLIHKRIYSDIDGLRSRHPPNVDQASWEELVNQTLTAYGNVCFSPEHVSNEEMARLRNELAIRLRA